MQATYRLHPERPILVRIARGKAVRATFWSSRPFRIGETSYCSGVTHALPDNSIRGHRAAVEAIGSEAGELRVTWS